MARAKFANEIWYVIVCDVLTPKILPHCTLQWGSSGTPSNYLVTVNLPISFTDGAYAAVALASLLNSNTNHDAPIVAKWESATKATFTFGTTMPQAPSCRYIILGR